MRTTHFKFVFSDMIGDCCVTGHVRSLQQLPLVADGLSDQVLTLRNPGIFTSDTPELTFDIEDDEREDFLALQKRIAATICAHFEQIGLDCQLVLPADMFASHAAASQHALTWDNWWQSWVDTWHLKSHWIQGSVGLVFGFGSMLACQFMSLPIGVMLTLALCSAMLTTMLGMNSFKQAYFAFIKEGRLTMDSLFVVSATTTMVVSLLGCVVPGLPMMCDAGLMIFGFRHIGEGIKQSLRHSLGLQKRFQDRVPATVKRFTADGSIESIRPDVIEVGDMLLLQSGTIPVDGICCSGASYIQTSLIDGGDEWCRAAEKEPINAGSYLKLGSPAMHFRATATVANSFLAQRDAELEHALAQSGPLQAEADRWLQVFIPAIIVIALLSAGLVGYFYTFTLAIQCAVTVLVSACPCTLSMTTSLALREGMKKASNAQFSIKYKNPEALEKANRITRVAFDLFGTLTDKRSVHKIICNDATLAPHELFRYFLALERDAHDSIADTINQYAQEQRIPLPELSSGFAVQVDSSTHSRRAVIAGSAYLMGDVQVLQQNQIEVHPIADATSMDASSTMLYLARDGQHIGTLVLRAPVRKDAVKSLCALKNMGYKLSLITGNRDKAAVEAYRKELQHIASEDVYLGCRDKAATIRQLGAESTCMVGDAGNDAPALSQSGFGVAVQSSGHDPITAKSADVVICPAKSSLLSIVTALEVAKQTLAHVQQNLLFSLVYNLLVIAAASGLLLSLGIALNPGAGALLMIVQSSLVMWNTHCFAQEPLIYATASPDAGDHSSSFGAIMACMMPWLTKTAPGFNPESSAKQANSNAAHTPAYTRHAEDDELPVQPVIGLQRI